MPECDRQGQTAQRHRDVEPRRRFPSWSRIGHVVAARSGGSGTARPRPGHPAMTKRRARVTSVRVKTAADPPTTSSA